MATESPPSRRSSAATAASPSTPPPTTDFDIQTLTYFNPTDPNLLCPICHSPLILPVQTPCLHTFCTTCINLALDRSPTCPVDRSPLSLSEITPSPIMISNLVNELVVVCPNSDKGCASTCPRYLVEGHLRYVCGFAEVACGVEGCAEGVMRREKGGECLHKEVECEDCQVEVRKLDLEAHKLVCPNLYTTCLHCSADHPRSEIQQHSFTCPSAIIPCPSVEFGCPFTTTRAEMPDHTSNCAFVQLTPLLQLHAERISKLELENRAIRKKLDLVLPLTRRHHHESSSHTSTSHSHPHTNTTTNTSDSLSSPTAATTTVSATTGFEMEEQTYHLFAEQEALRNDVDRIATSLGDLEVKQAMLFMNEGLRYNEEMQGVRSAINGLRMQLHWLVTRANSQVGGGLVSGGGNVAGNGGQQGGGGQGGGGQMRTLSDTPRQIVKL